MRRVIATAILAVTAMAVVITQGRDRPAATTQAATGTARIAGTVVDSNSQPQPVRKAIVTLTGGVHLTQGENRVQGGRLVLDLNSHRAVMDGGGPTGRVSGRFTVPQRQGDN